MADAFVAGEVDLVVVGPEAPLAEGLADALDRDESCGGHFRVEHQTSDGEAVRNDEDFAHVSVWAFNGEGKTPVKHKEELNYQDVQFQTRSYK